MSEDNKVYRWKFEGYPYLPLDMPIDAHIPYTRRKWWQFWKPRYFVYHVPVGDKKEKESKE